MDLDLARIEEAAHIIDPAFRDSPQYIDERLCEALKRRVLVKLETANPIRSFKGRGADFMLRHISAHQEVVCASAGNFGQAMAYCGRARGIAVRVFVAPDINPDKRARMEALGAKVIVADNSTAQEAAEAYARTRPGAVCLHDGREATIAEGAGTIGVELAAAEAVDTVVLPVGDGALINGVGRWIKATRPGTRVVGVNATGAASMRESLRAGRPVTVPRVDTFADGIGITLPFGESVRRATEIVDDILLVTDADLAAAMRLTAQTLRLLPEPAGVAGIAAIASGQIPEQSIATVLTGANPRPEQLRVLAAELTQ